MCSIEIFEPSPASWLGVNLTEQDATGLDKASSEKSICVKADVFIKSENWGSQESSINGENSNLGAQSGENCAQANRLTIADWTNSLGVDSLDQSQPVKEYESRNKK